ncbi:MAG: hypothetical protein ABI467_14010 [Kofleriaceae bacterium]
MLRSLAVVAAAGLVTFAAPRPAAAFDTWWHAECTRKAMEANGFDADSRLVTQFENYLTDVFPGVNIANEWLQDHKVDALGLVADASYEWMHFDAVFTTDDVIANWARLRKNTITALQHWSADKSLTGNFRRVVLLGIVGASLHTVQDFYSHSNWVNYWSGQGKPVPVFFDVDPKALAGIDIHSGAYPDGSSKGHENHGDLNKDSSVRKLNVPAVEVATRASVAWVKMLMDAVPNAGWADLKAMNVHDDRVLKPFLMELDSTFLTSSSIVAHHFDGVQPAKHVFSKDPDTEEHQAYAALGLTVSRYLPFVNAAKNPFHLPSPFWAGHMQFHITHELADGLLLNGKKYEVAHGR